MLTAVRTPRLLADMPGISVPPKADYFSTGFAPTELVYPRPVLVEGERGESNDNRWRAPLGPRLGVCP